MNFENIELKALNEAVILRNFGFQRTTCFKVIETRCTGYTLVGHYDNYVYSANVSVWTNYEDKTSVCLRAEGSTILEAFIKLVPLVKAEMNRQVKVVDEQFLKDRNAKEQAESVKITIEWDALPDGAVVTLTKGGVVTYSGAQVLGCPFVITFPKK